MARKFKELFDKLSPEARAYAIAKANEELAAIALAELREARKLTQVQLAKRLKVNQGAISKMEHRADMYLSTLRDVVRAMGGSLEVLARFPSGEVHLLELGRGAAKAR